MKPRTIIVGAGIGGLSAALALLKYGLPVSVYERSPELTEVGAGLTLSPNGTRLLYELGLRPQVDELAVPSKLRELRLWNTGQAWELPNQGADSTARFGAPYVMMHRGDLHNALAEAVRALDPDAIHLDARVTDLRHDADGVEIDLHDGTTVRGEVLVGADGIHSVVRQKLHPAIAKPYYAGKVFWRGMIPMDLVPQRERDIAGSWISPRGNVTVYPVRRAELLNFVGTVEKPTWDRHSWNEVGSREELLADFEGWHENIIAIISAIETPYKWGSFLHETVQEWSIGRTSLLGDSAHATPPSLGQGANMAIEDAVVLARCLNMDPSNPVAALRRYQSARAERTKAIVDKSWAQSRRRHNAALADPSAAAAYISENWARDRVNEWYDWIYDYDAMKVAI